MAAYLATASVGNYELRFSESPSGVPIIDAVDKDLPASASSALARTGEMISFYEDIFGPYPFVAYGAIVDDDSVGYALETQTRSIFSRSAGESTVAHELVHQWIGDDVSVERWADIWHNEGWATYGAWLWTEHRGGRTAKASFDAVMARSAADSFWKLVVADPGALHLFDSPIYNRGGAMLYALRGKIGDHAFLTLTRSWVSQHSGSHASTADYMALAEKVSGQDLAHFFDVWLFKPEKPASW
jgi:aminopeptidase N